MTMYSWARPSRRDEVEAHLPVGDAPEAVGDLGFVEDAALDDLSRDDFLLAGLQAAQELVERKHPLGETPLDDCPIRRRNQAGHIVRRMGLVRPGDAETALLLQHLRVGAARPPVPLTHANPLHLLQYRPVE